MEQHEAAAWPTATTDEERLLLDGLQAFIAQVILPIEAGVGELLEDPR